MPTATFAVLAGPMPPLKADFEQQEPAMPYADRPKVKVEVAPGTTLQEALRDALDRLGVRVEVPDSEGWAPPPQEHAVGLLYFIAFYQPEDEQGVAVGRQWQTVTNLAIVGEDGAVRWGQTMENVTFADLERTAEAGLLDGDPYRPYAILHPPAGNGVMLVWAIISTALLILKGILSSAADVEGTLQFKERIERRVGRGKEAVDAHLVALEERGGYPHAVMRLLAEKSWETNELAERLACSGEIAEGLLEAFGYTQGESGLWRRGEELDAKFMQDAIEEAGFAWEREMTAFGPTFRDRMTEYVETGTRPKRQAPEGFPENWYEMTPEAQDAWMEAEWGDEDDLSDLGEEEQGDDSLGIPIEHLELRCACGQEGCQARVSFEQQGENVRFKFDNVADHFVMSAEFMITLGMELED